MNVSLWYVKKKLGLANFPRGKYSIKTNLMMMGRIVTRKGSPCHILVLRQKPLRANVKWGWGLRDETSNMIVLQN